MIKKHFQNQLHEFNCKNIILMMNFHTRIEHFYQQNQQSTKQVCNRYCR